ATMAKKKEKKIQKIANILAYYADRIKLYACYNKFMQVRITNLGYNNFNLEIDLIRTISGNIGKQAAEKLMNALSDIINNKHANNLINAAKIKIKSEQYREIGEINT